MSTFQVPQFIDQKAKIVGVLNLAQFGYLAVAGLLVFGLFYVFNLFVWILISIPIAGFALFFSFAKINGQEAPKIFSSMVQYIFGSKIYVWKREMPQTTVKLKSDDIDKIRKSMHLQEKIKSIALSVTTHKNAGGTNQKTPQEQEQSEIVTYSTGEKKLAKRVDY
jgi:hypothetical protein